ncbi:unnamed protein product [Darwinula stevensoni]|uniref:Uncharacterized protein n=1 Tax=Darwinula stevensoni TaxID=69355 RepID=A0A7R8XFE1_9CRUS|nr:unnamed protein product [Darwinula stevensoni]CAG0895439.1 unnamed protein product [Darwinula stevensoni]
MRHVTKGRCLCEKFSQYAKLNSCEKKGTCDIRDFLGIYMGVEDVRLLKDAADTYVELHYPEAYTSVYSLPDGYILSDESAKKLENTARRNKTDVIFPSEELAVAKVFHCLQFELKNTPSLTVAGYESRHTFWECILQWHEATYEKNSSLQENGNVQQVNERSQQGKKEESLKKKQKGKSREIKKLGVPECLESGDHDVLGVGISGEDILVLFFQVKSCPIEKFTTVNGNLNIAWQQIETDLQRFCHTDESISWDSNDPESFKKFLEERGIELEEYWEPNNPESFKTFFKKHGLEIDDSWDFNDDQIFKAFFQQLKKDLEQPWGPKKTYHPNKPESFQTFLDKHKMKLTYWRRDPKSPVIKTFKSIFDLYVCASSAMDIPRKLKKFPRNKNELLSKSKKQMENMRLLLLSKRQHKLAKSEEKFIFICGGSGTGKTLVLVKRALDFVQNCNHYILVVNVAGGSLTDEFEREFEGKERIKVISGKEKDWKNDFDNFLKYLQEEGATDGIKKRVLLDEVPITLGFKEHLNPENLSTHWEKITNLNGFESITIIFRTYDNTYSRDFRLTDVKPGGVELEVLDLDDDAKKDNLVRILTSLYENIPIVYLKNVPKNAKNGMNSELKTGFTCSIESNEAHIIVLTESEMIGCHHDSITVIVDIPRCKWVNYIRLIAGVENKINLVIEEEEFDTGKFSTFVKVNPQWTNKETDKISKEVLLDNLEKVKENGNHTKGHFQKDFPTEFIKSMMYRDGNEAEKKEEMNAIRKNYLIAIFGGPNSGKSRKVHRLMKKVVEHQGQVVLFHCGGVLSQELCKLSWREKEEYVKVVGIDSNDSQERFKSLQDIIDYAESMNEGELDDEGEHRKQEVLHMKGNSIEAPMEDEEEQRDEEEPKDEGKMVEKQRNEEQMDEKHKEEEKKVEAEHAVDKEDICILERSWGYPRLNGERSSRDRGVHPFLFGFGMDETSSKAGSRFRGAVDDSKMKCDELSQTSCTLCKENSDLSRLQSYERRGNLDIQKHKIINMGGDEMNKPQATEEYVKKLYPEAYTKAYSLPDEYILNERTFHRLMNMASTNDGGIEMPSGHLAIAMVFNKLKDAFRDAPSLTVVDYDFSRSFFRDGRQEKKKFSENFRAPEDLATAWNLPRNPTELFTMCKKQMSQLRKIRTPQQRQLVMSEEQFIFIGGGNGTGKTEILMDRALKWANTGGRQTKEIRQRIHERIMGGEAVQEAVCEWVRSQPKEFFEQGIRRLASQWKKCLANHDVMVLDGGEENIKEELKDLCNFLKERGKGKHVFLDEIPITFGFRGCQDEANLSKHWEGIISNLKQHVKTLTLAFRPHDSSYTRVIDLRGIQIPNVHVLCAVQGKTRNVVNLVMALESYSRRKFFCDQPSLKDMDFGQPKKEVLPKLHVILTCHDFHDVCQFQASCEVVRSSHAIFSLVQDHSGKSEKPIYAVVDSMERRNRFVNILSSMDDTSVIFIDKDGTFRKTSGLKTPPVVIVTGEQFLGHHTDNTIIILDLPKCKWSNYTRMVSSWEENIMIVGEKESLQKYCEIEIGNKLQEDPEGKKEELRHEIRKAEDMQEAEMVHLDEKLYQRSILSYKVSRDYLKKHLKEADIVRSEELTLGQIIKHNIVEEMKQRYRDSIIHVHVDDYSIHAMETKEEIQSWTETLEVLVKDPKMTLTIVLQPHSRGARGIDVYMLTSILKIRYEATTITLPISKWTLFRSTSPTFLSHISRNETNIPLGLEVRSLLTASRPAGLVHGPKPKYIKYKCTRSHMGMLCKDQELCERVLGVHVCFHSVLKQNMSGDIVYVFVSDNTLMATLEENTPDHARKVLTFSHPEKCRGSTADIIVTVNVEDIWLLESISRATTQIFIIDTLPSHQQMWNEMQEEGHLEVKVATTDDNDMEKDALLSLVEEMEVLQEFGRVKQEVHLAQKMKELCESQDGYIYELQSKKTKGDFQNRVQKQEIGNRRPEDGVGKVLMLVGATGAGKSTLIHGFANYAYGVNWTDDFRFKLAVDEEKTVKSEAHSQTKWISAYVLTKQQGMAFPYTLTVIDTPGFGDTEGIKKDDEVKNQIREFFSHDGHLGVDQLDGIGFVVQSSQARLTLSQKYVFDCVLSMFGIDVKDNIFLLATFADNQTPPVMSAVKEANIPCRKMFKFNNSALFAQNKEDEFGKAYWKMGSKSFKEFFLEFESTNAVSLTLTKEVLIERRALEETLQSIKSQLDAALDRLELLREAHAAVRHHGGQESQVYASSVSSEEEEEEEDNSRARCSHPNRTIHSYDEHVLKKLTKGFNQNRELVLQLTKQAHARKQRLDEIALKLDPLEFTEYIDILISNEKYDNQPGSSQRIKYLHAAREKAEFATELLQSINPSDVLDELDIVYCLVPINVRRSTLNDVNGGQSCLRNKMRKPMFNEVNCGLLCLKNSFKKQLPDDVNKNVTYELPYPKNSVKRLTPLGVNDARSASP